MARFLVFDTQSHNDSGNSRGPYCYPRSLWGTPAISAANGENIGPFTPWIYQGGVFDDGAWGQVARSYPVRLFAANGPVKNIAWEFDLIGNVTQDISISWYQEFYNDQGDPATVPWEGYDRLPVLNTRFQWARECVEEVADTGAITHTKVVRTVVMNSNPMGTRTDPPIGLNTGIGDSVYFPMVVHGLWVRLAVWTTSAWMETPVNGPYRFDVIGSPVTPRLQIYAVVGGHDQLPAMDLCAANGLLWWDGNINGPVEWNPNNPGQAINPNQAYSGSWSTWPYPFIQ